jgi:hypothetical protein
MAEVAALAVFGGKSGRTLEVGYSDIEAGLVLLFRGEVKAGTTEEGTGIAEEASNSSLASSLEQGFGCVYSTLGVLGGLGVTAEAREDGAVVKRRAYGVGRRATAAFRLLCADNGVESGTRLVGGDKGAGEVVQRSSEKPASL